MDIVPHGETVVTMSEVMQNLQTQVLDIFVIAGLFLFIYIAVYPSLKNKLQHKYQEEIDGFMEAGGVLASLTIMLIALFTRMGWNL